MRKLEKPREEMIRVSRDFKDLIEDLRTDGKQTQEDIMRSQIKLQNGK